MYISLNIKMISIHMVNPLHFIQTNPEQHDYHTTKYIHVKDEQ